MIHTALLLPLLLAAAPAGQPPAIPDKWDADLEAGLPGGQALTQKLVGDLDGDKKPEWVAIGRPKKGSGRLSIAIFAPPRGSGKPTLRFAQWWDVENATLVGAVIRPVRPLGNAVVVVAVAPDPGADSTYTVNVYGWQKSRKDFRAMVPERLFFKSQGGFAIENFDKSTPDTDELVAWTYLTEEGEQLYDFHRYSRLVWRFDGVRFARERGEKRTEKKFPDPAAAARGIGLETGDVRKTIPGIVGAMP